MLNEGDLWQGYGVSLPGDDRKYHVRHHQQHWTVIVRYRLRDEPASAWVPNSRQCPELVDAVNRVAQQHSGQPGGSFYFNEHDQVLKPIWGEGKVELRYVGEFPDCRFRFDLLGDVWDSRPPHSPNANRQLVPGDDWPGPRCGIPYWLDGREGNRIPRIYRPTTLQSEEMFVKIRSREYLDEHTRSYKRLARRIAEAKGGSGGRFYVTEGGSVWTPYHSGPKRTDWNDRYVGCLWDYTNDWYPKWCGASPGS